MWRVKRIGFVVPYARCGHWDVIRSDDDFRWREALKMLDASAKDGMDFSHDLAGPKKLGTLASWLRADIR